MTRPQHPSGAARAVALALAALALAACGSRAERAPEAAAGQAKPARGAALASGEPTGAPAAAPPGPPAVTFSDPQPWRSSKPEATPVAPPPLSTWRALVSQNQPLQVKTPRWQPLPPRETVELAMPPRSAFRCVVTPLRMAPETNDFNTRLKAWIQARRLLCSSDGFRTWTEHVHTLRLSPDGTPPQPLPEMGALLRERDAAAGVRHSYVLVRSDEEVRAATTGPPRLLPGVAVDED